MIRYVHRSAHSAFGIGIAIGLLFNLVLYEPLARAAAAAALPDPPQYADLCEEMPPGLTPEEEALVNTRCQVHQAIFADQTGPSLVYGFTDPMPQPGTWTGHDYLGRPVEFRAVWTLPINLRKLAPDLWARGIEAFVVVGRLTGPAGGIHVSGLEIRTGDLSLDNEYVLFVSETLNSARADDFATDARIKAGVRVTNVTTGVSMPLSEVEALMPLWASSGDPATLLVMNGGAPVTPGCIQHAYETYNNCMRTADRMLELCVIGVMATWAGCMFATCAPLALVPTPLPVAMLLCVARCFAVMGAGLVGCGAVYAVQAESCRNQLIIDLRACGVNIVEY